MPSTTPSERPRALLKPQGASPFARPRQREPDIQTDADEIHLSRAGIPTGLISVPTRYVHSPCETCSLDDVEAVVQLVVAFARRLAREQSFVR